ncbi:hypothetical protein NDU88_011093 [Pleurodeles waltl]|uniref:Uncharacterized protein n=1 Tax=Pleurodeles waltl TaxID=8319 RepID=A0AAV7R224_PLEWA|nr:hypothetical protein NDU88_011093 [Pleurodeles waltl]
MLCLQLARHFLNRTVAKKPQSEDTIRPGLFAAIRPEQRDLLAFPRLQPRRSADFHIRVLLETCEKQCRNEGNPAGSNRN